MAEKAPEDVKAVWVDGHWEIAPGLIGSQVPLPLQQMNLAERERIIRQRLRYLDFIHDHFADSIVAPPAGVVTVTVEGESGH